MMRIPIAIAIVLAGMASATARPRVASINVCTDQLVMALADPDQIAALGPYSRDPRQSLAAEQAFRFRQLSGHAEDVLALRPDLVVASRFDKRETRAMLKSSGLEVAEFSLPQTLDEGRAQIATMGRLLEQPERAKQQIARIDAAIGRARLAAGSDKRVLALSRRGWVAGDDSLLSAMLREAGLRNAAAEVKLAAGGFLTIEAIIRLKPDLLLVSETGEYAEDEGRAFLLHPALERLYPARQRMVLPILFSDCGGPAIADALDRLVRELRRVSIGQ